MVTNKQVAIAASLILLSVGAAGCKIEPRPIRSEDRPVKIKLPPEPHAAPLAGFE